MKTEIKLDIQAQPDDETCGATCLLSLYRFYGVGDITLERLIKEIGRLAHGGTLAEILAVHALRRGFDATIYTYHLQMFDPTWFADDGEVHDGENVIMRLKAQLKHKKSNRRLGRATKAFEEFIRLGGKLKLEDLTPRLLTRYISEGVPIITGLSSTFLYRTARELSPSNQPDDIRGEPQGHFVMLVGYDSEDREVLIADPLDQNPPFFTNKYRLGIDRLVNAILLGVFTHDANLLVITPRTGLTPSPSPATELPTPVRPAARSERSGAKKRSAKARASPRKGGDSPRSAFAPDQALREWNG